MYLSVSVGVLSLCPSALKRIIHKEGKGIIHKEGSDNLNTLSGYSVPYMCHETTQRVTGHNYIEHSCV